MGGQKKEVKVCDSAPGGRKEAAVVVAAPGEQWMVPAYQIRQAEAKKKMVASSSPPGKKGGDLSPYAPSSEAKGATSTRNAQKAWQFGGHSLLLSGNDESITTTDSKIKVECSPLTSTGIVLCQPEDPFAPEAIVKEAARSKSRHESVTYEDGKVNDIGILEEVESSECETQDTEHDPEISAPIDTENPKESSKPSEDPDANDIRSVPLHATGDQVGKSVVESTGPLNCGPKSKQGTDETQAPAELNQEGRSDLFSGGSTPGESEALSLRDGDTAPVSEGNKLSILEVDSAQSSANLHLNRNADSSTSSPMHTLSQSEHEVSLSDEPAGCLKNAVSGPRATVEDAMDSMSSPALIKDQITAASLSGESRLSPRAAIPRKRGRLTRSNAESEPDSSMKRQKESGGNGARQDDLNIIPRKHDQECGTGKRAPGQSVDCNRTPNHGEARASIVCDDSSRLRDILGSKLEEILSRNAPGEPQKESLSEKTHTEGVPLRQNTLKELEAILGSHRENKQISKSSGHRMHPSLSRKDPATPTRRSGRLAVTQLQPGSSEQNREKPFLLPLPVAALSDDATSWNLKVKRRRKQVLAALREWRATQDPRPVSLALAFLNRTDIFRCLFVSKSWHSDAMRVFLEKYLEKLWPSDGYDIPSAPSTVDLGVKQMHLACESAMPFIDVDVLRKTGFRLVRLTSRDQRLLGTEGVESVIDASLRMRSFLILEGTAADITLHVNDWLRQSPQCIAEVSGSYDLGQVSVTFEECLRSLEEHSQSLGTFMVRQRKYQRVDLKWLESHPILSKTLPASSAYGRLEEYLNVDPLAYGPFTFGGSASAVEEEPTRQGRLKRQSRSRGTAKFGGSTMHLDGMGSLCAAGCIKGGRKRVTCVESADALLALHLAGFKSYAKPGGSRHLVNPPISEQIRQLWQNAGIRFSTFDLHTGDAYIVPAGVPHEFMNMEHCLSIAWNFAPHPRCAAAALAASTYSINEAKRRMSKQPDRLLLAIETAPEDVLQAMMRECHPQDAYIPRL